MERRHDDYLQRSLIVENPLDVSSFNNNNNNSPETLNLNLNLDQLTPSPSHDNHFIWQNPISSSQNRSSSIYQTQSPLLQNLFYQNPTSQNHLLVHENRHQLPNYHLINDVGDGHLNTNHIFAESLGMPNNNHLSLEAALTRMKISTATQSHQFLDNNFGFSSAYSQEHPLNRMTSLSASNSGYYNLAALNHNRHNLRLRTPSYDGLNYRQTISNQLDSSSRRARSINGLDSAFAPLYHGQIVQARSHESYNSLEQVRGRVAMVARDKEGCCFLQSKVDELIPEQTKMIFLELKDHLGDLIVDQFANYLIQKLFVACNKDQLNQLLLSLIQNGERLKNICIHPHGTRAMQKLIELVKDYPEQKSSLVSALKNITVYLAKNQNGHHVIQQCLKCFGVDHAQHLLEEIAQSCLEIATDKSGCCVLQKAVDKANGEVKERIISKITDNAFVLSIDPYGNYVVQYILQMHKPHSEAAIMNQLIGNFVNLSMDKYGSNVVEKCLKECRENNAAGIIQELADSPSILQVLQHPFGNYVVQSALDVAKGDLYHYFVQVINLFYRDLHSHLHGKKVLARTRLGKWNNRA